MNCKKGDLAVVVRSWSGREGSIVRCVEFMGDVVALNGVLIKDCWLIEYRGSVAHPDAPNARAGAPDSNLRPIRDTRRPDEMLIRIGKPEGVST